MDDDKKVLYHWLWQKVECQQFGLRWIDRDKQMFHIPWTHKNNPGWNEADGQVFKEWAIHKNNYKEGEEDWSRWKTNFRVALHKLPDFEEVREMHNTGKDVTNPYRVYRFVTTQSKRQADIVNNPNIPVLVDLAQAVGYEEMIMDHDSFPSDLKDIPSDKLMPKLPSREMEQNISDLGSLPSATSIPDGPVVHYEIYYLHEVVKKGSVGNDKTYLDIGQVPNCDHHENEVNPNRIEKIEFPDVFEIDIQRKFTGDQQKSIHYILSQMHKGFFLHFDEGNIYVKRLCKSRIYTWSFLLQNVSLDKTSKEPTKVFDLKDFNENLKESPCTILCFAQPVTPETLGKLIVHMKVFSVAATELKKKAGLLTEPLSIDEHMSSLSL